MCNEEKGIVICKCEFGGRSSGWNEFIVLEKTLKNEHYKLSRKGYEVVSYELEVDPPKRCKYFDKETKEWEIDWDKLIDIEMNGKICSYSRIEERFLGKELVLISEIDGVTNPNDPSLFVEFNISNYKEKIPVWLDRLNPEWWVTAYTGLKKEDIMKRIFKEVENELL